MASEILRFRQQIASSGFLPSARLPVVGPPVGVEAGLADRGDVDHVVHAPVAGSG
jgi:hypothetical protein